MENYYPTHAFSVDLDQITERVKRLKTISVEKGIMGNFVIFKNGTVIYVPKNEMDSFELAKGFLNECMGNHPDFRIIEDKPKDDSKEFWNVILMGRGNISSYMLESDWESVKDIVSRDDMLCKSEVLTQVDEDTIDKSLYLRLRVFADGKNPELHQVL